MQMTVNDIIREYANGKRDFRNIVCRNGQFDNLVLEGCNFSGSNMGFSSFRETDLKNCNLSDAIIEWSNFTDADLTNADLTKAKADHCSFNNANMRDAILTNTDFQWSVLFNVIQNFKDMGGANFHGAVFHESELTKEGIDQARAQLMAMNGLIPEDVFIRTTFSVNSVVQKAKEINIEMPKTGGYGAGFAVGGGYGSGLSLQTGYGELAGSGPGSYSSSFSVKEIGYGR